LQRISIDWVVNLYEPTYLAVKFYTFMQLCHCQHCSQPIEGRDPYPPFTGGISQKYETEKQAAKMLTFLEVPLPFQKKAIPLQTWTGP
jgi:hypothetical protein